MRHALHVCVMCLLSPSGPDGKTLRERLTLDLLDANAGKKKVTWGPFFYEQLRMIYRNPEAGSASLVAPSPSHPVSHSLSRGFEALEKTKPDRSLLWNYIKVTQTACNPTEAVGLGRFFLSLKPSCEKQRLIALDAVRYMARTQWDTTHRDVFVVIRPWIDTVACIALHKHRTQKCDDASFWSVSKAWLPLLLDQAAMTAVQSAKQVSEVKPQLMKLIAACNLGARLFMASMETVLREMVSELVDQEVRKLFMSSAAVTEAKMGEAIAKAMEMVEGLDGIHLLPGKAEVQVQYCGTAVVVLCSSLSAHVTLAFWLVAKEIAVVNELIPKFWNEDLFVLPAWKMQWKAKVAEDLVEAAGVARAALNSAIRGSAASTSERISKLVSGKAPNMLMTDPHFGLELACIQELVGSRSEFRIRDLLLSKLPSSTKAVTVSACAAALQVLQASEGFKLASLGAQSRFGEALKMVVAISEDRPPNVKEALKCSFLGLVVARLQYFLTWPGAGGKSTTGADALPLIVAHAESLVQRGTLAAEAAVPLKVYSWLLQDSLKARVAAIVKAWDDQQGQSVGKTLARTSKGGPKVSKSSSSKDAATDASSVKARSMAWFQ